MAFFDADLSVNNSKLNELEFLVENNVNVYKKKDLLYYEKDNKVLEVGGVLKEKNDGTISGKVISLAVKDTENDDPVWDLSNFSFDANKLEDMLRNKSIEKVCEKLFEGKDTVWGSHFNDELFGFDGNDTVEGWRGDDRLNGGKGKDELQGDQGADTYVFDQKLTSKNVDTIVKFNEKDDLVELKQKIFTDLKKGELHEDYFTVGKKAEGDNPQIIYRPDKGHLLYDADGAGGKDPVKFADIGKHKDLSHDDFFVS